jgi:hypothetical protein
MTKAPEVTHKIPERVNEPTLEVVLPIAPD